MIALAFGALVCLILTTLVAAHVTVFSLDESLYQQSALHYASNLPGSLFHDIDARATDRLYALILSIAYRITGGPAAVRIDHVLSAVMYVSAVIPIYLMARIVLGPGWPAVGAALLSVAAPWLTLTSALFTENLAYPLFWWLLLAICAAVWEPSRWRDLAVLGLLALLVCTRVQFAEVFPGYFLCAAVACLVRGRDARGAGARLRGAAGAFARDFSFTAAALALAVVALALARTSGQWHAHVQRLFGSYTNVIIRNGPTPDVPKGLFVEVIALSLGVGLLPALISVPWYAERMLRPVAERRWAYPAVSGVVMAIFLVLTVYSQGGYLGPITEERYFFYVIPALWIGAFAALGGRGPSMVGIAVWAVVLAVLFAWIRFLPPLTEETAFLAPVESVVPRIMGQASLVALTIAGAAASIVVWSRWRRGRLALTVALGALLQLGLSAYAFAAILGGVDGVPGRTGGDAASYAWIDAHAGSSAVTWLGNLATVEPDAIHVSAAGSAADEVHVALFWNSRLRDTAEVPAVGAAPLEFPLTGLPAEGPLGVRSDGQLEPLVTAKGMRMVVGEAASPFLQLAGTTLAQSPDRFLALTKLSDPVRAVWMTEGLQPDGYVAAGPPVRLRAWAPRGVSGGAELTVTMAFTAPSSRSAQPTALQIRVGSSARRIVLRPGSTTTVVRLSGCFRPGAGALGGSIAASRTVDTAGRRLAGKLQAVTVSQTSAAGCRLS